MMQKTLTQIIEQSREEEFKAVCRWIYSRATFQEIAQAINEIICVHDNLKLNDKNSSTILGCCTDGENLYLTTDKENSCNPTK